MADDRPEETCRRCGGANVIWCAPSPLWNAVMRGGSIDGPWEFNELICPACFITLAEERGIAGEFVVDARVVSVELETVTPSGRVWDAEAMLWRESSRAPVDAEIEQLTDALERHKRLVARYRKPMPEGGLTSSEKLHTSHVARVDAEARAEQVDAERERMLDLVKSMRQAIEFARCCDLSGERGWADHDSILSALDESQALLREHDRLGDANG